MKLQSSSIPRHLYPDWHIQARDAFERVYQYYLSQSIVPSTLKAAFIDAITPGRRIRPTLYYALWKCYTDNFPSESESLPAIAIELFHSASIIVDDIADQEISRRNKTPLYLLYDIDTAILVSHYLIARGYEALLKHINGERLSASWTSCYTSIIIGQSFDLKRDASISLAEQQRRSLEKTSAFFSFIAQAINICSGRKGSDLLNILERVGECFQVSNDIVDLALLESIGRHDKSLNYRLPPSYLIPLLIKSALIDENEVHISLPYERHLEISKAAQRIIGNIDSYLENLFNPTCESIKQADILPCERDIVIDFIRETTKSTFWLHNHD